MINSIRLQGVASYPHDHPVIVETNNKKVNLFYGANGAGKSTLGNYLYNPTALAFEHCSMQPEIVSENIFVYNQQFVRKNFHESTQQQGVFTLSEENKEAEEAIEAANLAIQTCNEQIADIQSKVSGKKAEITRAESKLTETIWKEKKKYDADTCDLKYCLSGAMKKPSFLAKVKKSSGVTERTIAELTKEAAELNGQNATARANVAEVLFSAIDIETKPIFKDPIIGSGDSYLAAIIKKLDNSGWVQQGTQFVNDENACPFCQQDLPSSFKSAVAQLFDESYQQKCDELVMLKNTYTKRVAELADTLNSNVYQSDYVLETPEYSLLKEALIDKLNANIELLDRKFSDPSESVNLASSRETLAQLNVIIKNISAKVTIFNDKIDHKDTHLDNIKNQFWITLHNQCSDLIESGENESAKLNKEIVDLNQELAEQSTELKSQERIIVENRKKITNIDSSIDNINARLQDLGLQGFELKNAGEESSYYKIVRQGEEQDVYKTLSEGEKTLITFLYFLEQCAGTVDQNSAPVLGDRIIVIDDPISSLSNNFVYDIASLIHHEVIRQAFKQIFILTHNLFFFHELLMLEQVKKSTKNYKLFRISKSDFSNIREMNRAEIQNDYQNYWQVIKDCLENRAYANMLPNAMRNILEYYFNFVHKKDKLKNELEKLGSTATEFKPLFRYINRASHSDSINISDFENIDVRKYVDKFRDVFIETGFKEHYYKMMGEEQLVEDNTL